MSTPAPTLADLLRQTQAAALGRVHTATPGTILSYDAARQAATVQPALRIPSTDPETGARVFRKLPPIASCPVLWPSGGGCSLTWPLEQGDPCTILVAERSTDEYRATGGRDVEPQDPRRFDWSDALVLPAWTPFNAPIPTAGIHATAAVLRADELRLGSSAATDWIALASLVLARLNAIETAFNAHTHAATGAWTGTVGGAAATGTVAGGTGAPTPTMTASTLDQVRSQAVRSL